MLRCDSPPLIHLPSQEQGSPDVMDAPTSAPLQTDGRCLAYPPDDTEEEELQHYTIVMTEAAAMLLRVKCDGTLIGTYDLNGGGNDRGCGLRLAGSPPSNFTRVSPTPAACPPPPTLLSLSACPPNIPELRVCPNFDLAGVTDVEAVLRLLRCFLRIDVDVGSVPGLESAAGRLAPTLVAEGGDPRALFELTRHCFCFPSPVLLSLFKQRGLPEPASDYRGRVEVIYPALQWVLNGQGIGAIPQALKNVKGPSDFSDFEENGGGASM